MLCSDPAPAFWELAEAALHLPRTAVFSRVLLTGSGGWDAAQAQLTAFERVEVESEAQEIIRRGDMTEYLRQHGVRVRLAAARGVGVAERDGARKDRMERPLSWAWREA